MRPIYVGILVSYDYELIKKSIPPVYEYADKIVLAVDKEGKTWAGNPIQISDEFWLWVKKFDVKNKIEIYRDSFYVEEFNTMQCDTRERDMLAKYLGAGCWQIQLDADEYFVDFKSFVDYLHWLDKKKKYINSVTVEWLSLYKNTKNGYLFITNGGGEVRSFATTKPERKYCRLVPKPKEIFYSQRIIHDSWSRTEQEMWMKITNWGHNKDFDTEGYFEYWKAINEKNYMFVRNFHPMFPEMWEGLEYVEAKDISDLLLRIKETEKDILKATKSLKKICRIVNLCVPPVFQKIYTKYIKK